MSSLCSVLWRNGGGGGGGANSLFHPPRPGLNSLNSISSGVYTNTTGGSSFITGSSGFTGSSPLPGTGGGTENASSEIDRIMAKIEQDNKILAELDKSRSTLGKVARPRGGGGRVHEGAMRGTLLACWLLLELNLFKLCWPDKRW